MTMNAQHAVFRTCSVPEDWVLLGIDRYAEQSGD